MSRTRGHAGTFELLTRLPYQIARLARLEYENAKRELVIKLKRGGIGLLSILFALFFVFFALSALVAAAIAGIATVWPLWLAALVVAAALLIVATATLLIGVALIRRGVPVPEDTFRRTEDYLHTLGEVRFNASAHDARRPAEPPPTRHDLRASQ